MSSRLWTTVLILSSAVIIVYINSFSGVFQFDDYRTILNYARAHSIVSWLYYFIHNIRPVLKVSFTLNWLSGTGLFGFHLFNLAIHIANTLLVYFISLKFLSPEEFKPLKDAAFPAALLFALHPIQTEAVTYICGRSVSLMTMFYLAGMFAYITGEEKNKLLPVYVLSPIFFTLAVMTRETALTLPAALLLWDLFHRRQEGISSALKRQWVHWAICILILGAVILNIKYEELLSFSYDLRGVKDNLFSQFNGLGYLLSRLVMINGLNIDPDVPAFTGWTPSLIIKAALILSLLVIAFVSLKKNSWIGFGIFWFFLHLFPTNSIIPRTDIANERHMYLPVWGLFLIVAIGIEKLKIRGRKVEDGGRKINEGRRDERRGTIEVEDRGSEVGAEKAEDSPAACRPAVTGLNQEKNLNKYNKRNIFRSPFPPLWGKDRMGGVHGGLIEFQTRDRLLQAGVVALLLVLGFFTWSRNNDYKSEVALWEDTVRKSPKRARCYNNLGFAYELEERYKEAKKAYMDASNIDPEYEFAKNNIARIDKILEGN